MNTDTRLGFMDASLSIRDETQMSVIALFTWIATVLFGLLLLVIWLMEYDREYQNEAATRLPIPVISAHALLGMGGLLLWAIYLLADQERVAWATVAVVTTVACLGLIMAVRWIGVYRTYADPNPSLSRTVAVPPERHFPLPVVITHGILAVSTVGLVLFSVLFAS
jgi:hypothetical protein